MHLPVVSGHRVQPRPTRRATLALRWPAVAASRATISSCTAYCIKTSLSARHREPGGPPCADCQAYLCDGDRDLNHGRPKTITPNPLRTPGRRPWQRGRHSQPRHPQYCRYRRLGTLYVHTTAGRARDAPAPATRRQPLRHTRTSGWTALGDGLCVAGDHPTLQP